MNRKKAQPDYDEKNRIAMSKKFIKELCEEHELYLTPHLNEKLYLHFKGFHKIENLDEFVNLRVLYLDNNCLTRIDGIGHLKELRSLYLQHNSIQKIEGLEGLDKLLQLNLSHNEIRSIENLKGLKLESLDLSHNYIVDAASLRGLTECQTITSFDLSNNETQYSDEVIDIFTSMENLKCLYLRENSLKKDVANFRKIMIKRISTLTFLDDRTVTEKDRRMVDAFFRGGKDEETNERLRIEEELREKSRQYAQMNEEREKKFRERKQKELERYERENREEREQLLKEREKLLTEKPEDWTSRIGYVNSRLQRVNELLDIKEDKVDEIMREEILAPMKYRCLMAVEGDDGKLKYVGHNTEEIEKFQKDKQKKIQEDIEKANQTEAVNSIKPEEKTIEVEFVWNEELEEVLENLVDEHAFDFKQITTAFNKHLQETEKENKSKRNINIDQLRKKWTQIEVSKYREEEEEADEPQQLASNATVQNDIPNLEKIPVNYDELE